MNKNFYITTTAPYVNAKPHIGFALEIVQADTIARYKRLQDYNVFFNFGTDEHGQKIYQKAIEAGKDPQAYTDEYAKTFIDLKDALNLSYDNFSRTTDPKHKKAAQHIWKLCDKNGYIEKGVYKAKYCVGCELEKQDSELVDGKCPLHPTLKIDLIEEENYFFNFSKLQDRLLQIYKKHPDFVIPSHRLTEISNFVGAGLQDFSISRLKEKMPWGVEVPGNNKHVMYVWFDALTYYISSLGWPENQERFEKFWGTIDSPNALQVAGKDNLRQQSAMWQAMLLAAGLPTSRQILIHGFITSGGQKMSKSVGNVIDPIEYVNKYGTDALRYYLLAKISPTNDSDFTRESFEQAYQADLANGLGNLVARIARLAELNDFSIELETYRENKLLKEIGALLESYRFDTALEMIWKRIHGIDEYINRHELWKIKGASANEILKEIVVGTESLTSLLEISEALIPFLPDTADEIKKIFGSNKKIKKPNKPLFPRLEENR